MAALSGCGHTNPYYDAKQPHHRPEGFQNNHGVPGPQGLAKLLRWRWEAWRNDKPAPASAPTPRVTPQRDWLQANAKAGAAMQPSVTWIGHSTALVQADGLNVLTDPVFSERASPVRYFGPQRAQPPGLALTELPHIDLVLISHDHYDHLDEASVLALAAQPDGAPLFIVPLGLKPWLAERGITRVVELDWWQSHRLGAVEVQLTPAQHWSGRGLFDRQNTLWGGFAVLGPGLSWYYAGDTGYSPDFAEIQRRLAPRLPGGGFDLALLPVGAYEPRWFMAAQHVNPDEAVRIHQDVRSRFSVGVHWGTFSLTDEALDQAPRDLAAARLARGVDEQAFVVLAVGETRRLSALAHKP